MCENSWCLWYHPYHVPGGKDVDTGGKAHSLVQQRVLELQFICSSVSICHIYLPYLSVTLQKCTWCNGFHLEHVNLLKFVPMTEVIKLKLWVYLICFFMTWSMPECSISTVEMLSLWFKHCGCTWCKQCSINEGDSFLPPSSPFKTPCFKEPYLNMVFIFYFELYLSSLSQIKHNQKVDWYS